MNQQQPAQRGRPKGSRNKSKPRDKTSILLRKVFRKDRVESIEALSKESGIGIPDVLDDMAAEGLTVLKEDVYAQIIKFRKRKGEVIHERVQRSIVPEGAATESVQESKGVDGSEESNNDAEVASIFLGAVQARERPIPARVPDADERPGQFPEDADNPLPVIGNELVDPGFPEIDPDLPL